MHQVTFLSLYKRVKDGKLTKPQFLQEIRKNTNLAGLISPTLNYEDSIKFLVNRRLLSIDTEKKQDKSFNLNRFINESKDSRLITIDEAHPYQYRIGIEEEMGKNGNDFAKAEKIVLKKLTKDRFHYTNKNIGVINEKDPNSLLKEAFLNLTQLDELSPSTLQSASDKALYDKNQPDRAEKFQQAVTPSTGLKTVTVEGRTYEVVKAKVESPNTAYQTLEIELTDGAFIEVQSTGVSFHSKVKSGLLLGPEKYGQKLPIDRATSKMLIKLHTKLFPGVGLDEVATDENSLFEQELNAALSKKKL